VITFRPTRRSQPYADPYGRPQTPQLAAMLQGRPLYGQNPIDHQRRMARLAAMILGRPGGR
jgi:hypothetical protein